jgi:hypothetical protein
MKAAVNQTQGIAAAALFTWRRQVLLQADVL